MWVPSDILRLARHPKTLLLERLAEPDSPHQLFLKSVTPLATIRCVAVFVRSWIEGYPLAGFVLGTSSFALQVGTWLGLAILLPTLARQFRTQIADRQSFALATYACTPMWLAGVLYLVPEDPAFLFFWSRSLAFVITAYGAFITHRGLVVLGTRRSLRMPLLGAIVTAAVVIYAALFVLLGIGSHVALFVFG